VETSLGSSGLVGDVFGLTEVALAILLVAILIWRPDGIVGGQELKWPLWKRRASAEEDGG
jgi:ABC-type branched-subunit amino acid transport system permease subunit